MKTLVAFILLNSIVLFSVAGNRKEQTKNTNQLPSWAFGGFIRPEGKNPIITPDTSTKFFCPMNGKEMGWEESDTFNPAAAIKDGKIVVLYRAEDNTAQGVGSRTSRIGYAESLDGITMSKRTSPVLYPDNDVAKPLEWPGGCEDPRVAVTEDGLYVMFYTGWNHQTPRLCVATSRDLIHWTKHGLAFAKAYDGKFKNMESKSASIVTKIINGKQVITKINGKYLMYWGEQMINAATSEDLINWTPQLNEKEELKGLVYPRYKYFDSALTECGPPAILTEKGILLLYNGKNRTDDKRDERFNPGTYSAGQILFDTKNPYKVIGRLDVPFFRPMEKFEKSGQYKDGTVFIEGLAFLKNKWYLYYGCADSKVGVAIYDPTKKTPGDPIE